MTCWAPPLAMCRCGVCTPAPPELTPPRLAVPSLAGRPEVGRELLPLRQHAQRRLAIRRACAKSFLQLCDQRCVDVVVKPLPYGCVRKY